METVRTEQIEALLGRWEQMTGDEGEALGEGDWQRVETLQKAKENLSTDLTLAGQRWEEAAARRGKPEGWRGHYREAIGRLLLMEQQNMQALQTASGQVRGELDAVGATDRNLRGVRTRYGGAPVSSWQSYS